MSSKNKSKWFKPKPPSPNNKTVSLCMNTDYVFDIKKHPINMNGHKILSGFCRHYTTMKDILNTIQKYFILYSHDRFVGKWKYYVSKEFGGETVTRDYEIEIHSNLSFSTHLYCYDGNFDSTQTLDLNGNAMIINAMTYLLFFDGISAKKLR
eukprot:467555_1